MFGRTLFTLSTIAVTALTAAAPAAATSPADEPTVETTTADAISATTVAHATAPDASAAVASVPAAELGAELIATIDRSISLDYSDGTLLYGMASDDVPSSGIRHSLVAIGLDGTIVNEAPVGGHEVVLEPAGDGLLLRTCDYSTMTTSVGLLDLATLTPTSVISFDVGDCDSNTAAIDAANPTVVWVPDQSAAAVFRVDLDAAMATRLDLSEQLRDNYWMGGADFVNGMVRVGIYPDWDPVTGNQFTAADGSPLPDLSLLVDPATEAVSVVDDESIEWPEQVSWYGSFNETPLALVYDTAARRSVTVDLPGDFGEWPSVSVVEVGDEVYAAAATDPWSGDPNPRTGLFRITGDVTAALAAADPWAADDDTGTGTGSTADSTLPAGSAPAEPADSTPAAPVVGPVTLTRVAEYGDRMVAPFSNDGTVVFGTSTSSNDRRTGSLVAIDATGAIVAEAEQGDHWSASASTIDGVSYLFEGCELGRFDPATLSISQAVDVRINGGCSYSLIADRLTPGVAWVPGYETGATRVDLDSLATSAVDFSAAIPELYTGVNGGQGLVPLGEVLYIALGAGWDSATGSRFTAPDGTALPPLLLRFDPATGEAATVENDGTPGVSADGRLYSFSWNTGQVSLIDPVTLALSPAPDDFEMERDPYSGRVDAADLPTDEVAAWHVSIDGSKLTVTARNPETLAVQQSASTDTGLPADAWPNIRLVLVGGSRIAIVSAESWANDTRSYVTEVYAVTVEGEPLPTPATFTPAAADDPGAESGDAPAGEVPAADVPAGAATARVTTSSGNVRSEPTTNGDIVDKVGSGDVVTITGDTVEADGYTWLPILTTGGVTGWIAAQLTDADV